MYIRGKRWRGNVYKQSTEYSDQYETNFECLIMKILFNGKDIKIICVVYRSESVKVIFFLMNLKNYSLSYMKKNMTSLSLGISRFHHDTLVESCDLSKYKTLLNCYFLSVRNFLPTRLTATSATCLDHVIPSYPVYTKTLKLTTSDHYAV